MEKYLTWTKGIFESTYQLFENGQIKGSLFFDTWKNQAKGMLEDKNVSFQTNGFLDSTTQIYAGNAELIATITFEIWQTKATVHFKSGAQYMFQFTNGWYTKWMITDLNKQRITYDSDTSSGRIVSNTTDEVMLFAGLYIKECFNRWLMLFIFLIVLIPIISRGVS